MLRVKKSVKTVFNIVLSILFVLCANYYLFRSNIFGKQTIFNVLLLLLIVKLCLDNLKKRRKVKISVVIFSLAFSLMLIVGNQVYLSHSISGLFNSNKVFLLSVLSLISFTKVFYELFVFLLNFLDKKSKDKQWSFFENKRIFLFVWLFILISWIPVLLAYYPGILSYDSRSQGIQAVLGLSSYSKFHPPIHTALLQFCIFLGGKLHIQSLLLYSIIQMIFLSFCFSYMIKFLIEMKVKNYIIVLSLLFVSINPIVAIFSIIMTKDVIFSGFFLLLFIEMLKLFTDSSFLKKPMNWLKIIIMVLMSSLFRNNFIYCFIAFFLITLFRRDLKAIILFIIPILLFFIVSDGLYSLLGIKDGNVAEMLSVPIEQISYVVVKHDADISDSNKEMINEYIPYDLIKKYYNPRITDSIKANFKSDKFKEDKVGFLSIWFKLLTKYPSDYISSFLDLNVPYWYIDANSLDKYSKREYIETGTYNTNYYSVNRKSKLPLLLSFYEKIVCYKFIGKIPLVSNVFSISLPIWLLLFSLLSVIYKKQYKLVYCLLLVILFWLTYLLGPVSNFRYIYPIICMYPILCSVIVDTYKFKSK